MCGRFTLRSNPHDIAEEFDISDFGELVPRFNVAPSQMVAAVRSPDGPRELVLLRWGLIPLWATDPKIGNQMINARSETVAEKPSFKKAFQRRRCLIVADGFFEWQKTGEKTSDKKQPFYIRLKSDKPFGFAGLWERNEKIGEPIESCTIITTTPNDLMATIHDRMPVIIPSEQYGLWLDPEVQDVTQLQRLLQPFPSDEMTAYPVSTLVGSPKNDLPQCIEPLVAL